MVIFDWYIQQQPKSISSLQFAKWISKNIIQTHSSLVGTDTWAMFNRNKQPKSRTWRMAVWVSFPQMCFISHYAFSLQSSSQVTATLLPIRQVSIEKLGPKRVGVRMGWRWWCVCVHQSVTLADSHLFLCFTFLFKNTFPNIHQRTENKGKV